MLLFDIDEKPQLPTWNEISSYPWENVALEAEPSTCHEIAERLLKKSSGLRATNDQVGERVFQFIGQLAFMHLDPSNPDIPFGAAVIMGTKRSAMLNDYGEDELALVHKLADETAIPALRARFSDILWVRQKDYKKAEQAAKDYLESFRAIDSAEK